MLYNNYNSKIDFLVEKGCVSLTNETKDYLNSHSEIVSIVIPEEYQDKKITKIGDNGFSNLKYIRTVVFPEKLKVIGREAFKDCSELRSVRNFDYFCIELNEIKESAFENCSLLYDIDLLSSADKLVIGKNAFHKCNMSFISFSAKEIHIQNYAFNQCKSLCEIEINGQVHLKRNSFYDCYKLTNIHFQKPILPVLESYILSPLTEAYIIFPIYFDSLKDELQEKIITTLSSINNSMMPTFINFHSKDSLTINSDNPSLDYTRLVKVVDNKIVASRFISDEGQK